MANQPCTHQNGASLTTLVGPQSGIAFDSSHRPQVLHMENRLSRGDVEASWRCHGIDDSLNGEAAAELTPWLMSEASFRLKPGPVLTSEASFLRRDTSEVGPSWRRRLPLSQLNRSR
jgi:hypothetical protein